MSLISSRLALTTLPAKTGHFSKTAQSMPGTREIDAVERLAGDDGGVVHAGSGVADDFVVLGILQFDGLRARAGQRGGLGGELAVGERSGSWRDGAPGRKKWSIRIPATLQVCAAAVTNIWRHGGAHPAQRIPVGRSRGAAAGDLRPYLASSRSACWMLDILPIDVELFGDQHGQLGL